MMLKYTLNTKLVKNLKKKKKKLLILLKKHNANILTDCQISQTSENTSHFAQAAKIMLKYTPNAKLSKNQEKLLILPKELA